ncbi:TPA: hypothetical protein DEW47_00620 [Patescibacteria group bacterium]|nr:MAG: hypothetical protein UT71_C0017G0026 [Parcubacteria group bacterium GW2011_GWF2_40_10]KKR47518.1 MAG: hypothetical protein UT83_C0008G0026 [Parcubacteria group bacterium GW2011_GWA2_40_143]KKR59937.1 MAG: hypothetical protein UT97_C0008G0027 [Parcubacteria group bacterium GW2011_GWC2_40_31]KKR74110.1 MAG: hypothetical protein UU18_C0034G0006 [Parcubacteria group bacterium GW2011_GWB2_40_8]KKR75307.1 MAG: hypothetical protein UU20_C0057G0005 [Parcubacteria group bacterium GW2011_GWE2_40_
MNKMNDLKEFFPGDNLEMIPLMFLFGEPAKRGNYNIDMGTRFAGEESMSHPDGPGSYDTD